MPQACRQREDVAVGVPNGGKLGRLIYGLFWTRMGDCKAGDWCYNHVSWAKPPSPAVHFRKQCPFQQGPGPGSLIWDGGTEHGAALHDSGIPILQPSPRFSASSSPRPIPGFGNTSVPLLPCFSPIALALPEKAKPERFAGRGEGPAAPAHPSWAARLAQLMGTRCHQKMATLPLRWAGVGILQPEKEMGRKLLP